MLVQPFLLIDGVRTQLSYRELRRAKDGFAVVRYGRYYNYVAHDFQILIDGFRPPQTGSVILKDSDTIPPTKAKTDGSEISSPREDKPFKLGLPTLLSAKMISFDGIDEGFLVLKNLRNLGSMETQSFNDAKKYRPRYEQLDLIHYSELQDRLTKVLCPDKAFLSLRVRFLAFPYNNFQYLKILQNMSNLNIEQLLSGILPKVSMDQNKFEFFLLSNMFFHHCIYCENPSVKIESDILNYQDNDSATLSPGESPCLDLFSVTTVEANKEVRRWRPATKQKILTLSRELPRRSRLMKNNIELSDPTYPKILKNLSVLTLASITFDTDLALRLSKLHRFGIRKVGQLKQLLDI